MSQKALVIGGTGPTGPHIVNGLIDRGYKTSILHRGTHDSDLIPAHAERIIGDPHFKETLSEALGDRRFDLIVATYGRIRYVAEVVAERTDRLITVGGSPGYRGTRQPDRLFPRGLQVPLPEDAPQVATEAEFRFGYLARISERTVMEHHKAGDYSATHLRYPLIYGPRQLVPMEWRVMRRILDGRKNIVLPDDGHIMFSRGYAVNMAHAVLLAVDDTGASGGKIYNVADTHQFTLGQWVEVIADAMDAKLEIIGIPGDYAYPARELLIGRMEMHHQLFDTHAIRADVGYADVVAPIEGLAETVRWYRGNPPKMPKEFEADLKVNYEVEDALVKLDRAYRIQLSKIEYISRPYRHPYAHPKRPNEKWDHRKR
ncbi:MAG: epimerase [Rickettsiales bacterium]|nr:epimerase [Rickettsiales bacterium]